MEAAIHGQQHALAAYRNVLRRGARGGGGGGGGVWGGWVMVVGGGGLAGRGEPIPLLPFTDPNFGMEDTRITFVRNRDGTIHGVLLIRGDGSSSYAWRASRSAAR